VKKFLAEMLNALYAIVAFRYQCYVGEEYVIQGIANPPWPATSVTIP
jgi:hypothetical protein